MIKLASRPGSAGVPVAILSVLVGCSGEPIPAAEPPTPPDAKAAPAAAPEPSASAAAEAPAPSASASAAASAGAKAEPLKEQSSGRPSVLKSDPIQISDSFGSSPGAKVEIGAKEIATFKIPELTLGQVTNITFKLDTKGRTGGPLVGKIYRMIPMLPPEAKPVTIPSNNGTPFELMLPAGNKKGVNLAIGTIEADGSGREKVSWQVIAPKRIDDATGIAYFELQQLTDSYLHVTTKPPTGAKK
jgi:hypothetical protein